MLNPPWEPAQSPYDPYGRPAGRKHKPGRQHGHRHGPNTRACRVVPRSALQKSGDNPASPRQAWIKISAFVDVDRQRHAVSAEPNPLPTVPLPRRPWPVAGRHGVTHPHVPTPEKRLTPPQKPDPPSKTREVTRSQNSGGKHPELGSSPASKSRELGIQPAGGEPSKNREAGIQLPRGHPSNLREAPRPRRRAGHRTYGNPQFRIHRKQKHDKAYLQSAVST